MSFKKTLEAVAQNTLTGHKQCPTLAVLSNAVVGVTSVDT